MDYLEKLWLVMFNYMKNNKNYKALKVKDYLLNNYKPKVKNNQALFSYFNIYCQLFITLKIDNSTYNAFISKSGIYVKNNETRKVVYMYNFQYNKKNIKQNKNIISYLQDNKEYIVRVEFSNNKIMIYINDNLLVSSSFIKGNILKEVEVYDMGEYNKFTDII